jgi:hypothetical protein
MPALSPSWRGKSRAWLPRWWPRASRRALVASLAVQLDLCSAASVARHFKRAKATLSERMAACRLQPEDQWILGTPLGRIVEEAIDLRHGPSSDSRCPSDVESCPD